MYAYVVLCTQRRVNKHPMKYIITLKYYRLLYLTVIIVVLYTAGCAATSTEKTDEQLRVLQREVTRLTSEKANLEARAGSLDDKVLLLETRLKKCGNPETRSLEVVRLSPSYSENEPQDEHALEDSYNDDTSSFEHYAVSKQTKDQKRPLLSLKENRVPAQSSGQRRPAVELLPVGAFEQMGADNLGVVTKNDNSTIGTDLEMNLFNDAYREYSNKKHDAAASKFADFIKLYPNHSYADDAMYWRGESFLAQGRFLHAVGEFERLIRRYPSSDKVASALYRIGFSYDKMQDYSKAAEFYFDVVERFSGTDAARKAGARVAEIRNSSSAKEALLPTSAVR